MRQLLLSPRWIVWHLLTLGGMAICGLFAAWQWQRAGSSMGSAFNVGYGLQWPLFAVFFGVMWWRMLRMEAARLEPSVGPAEADGAGPAGAATEAPARAASPAPARPRPAPGGPSPFGPSPIGPSPFGPSPFGPSPFGPRPTSGPDGRTDPADPADPELAEYNRMLADLAARPPGADAPDRPRTH